MKMPAFSRPISVMNMPIDHAPSHTMARHTSTPRMSPMSEQTYPTVRGVPLKPRLLAREA